MHEQQGLGSDESDVNHEELACVRNAWQQATDRASEAQELWGPRVHHHFEKDFAQVVRVGNPPLRHQRSAANTVKWQTLLIDRSWYLHG